LRAPVWVFAPTLGNYREVFAKNPLFTFALNSLVVAAGSTGLALLLGLPGAYAGRPRPLGSLPITPASISRSASGPSGWSAICWTPFSGDRTPGDDRAAADQHEARPVWGGGPAK